MTGNVALAFGLTVLAGLATGIGSLIALAARRTDEGFLAASLGFSAGVMIYVSFVELMANARSSLAAGLGPAAGAWVAVAAFFGGIFLIMVIDRMVPSFENPHENMRLADGPPPGLMRMGVMSALAIGIHNFPEGMATFAAALAEPKLGAAVAVAIGIHNIPEGISVSVPIYYATGSRKKAFWYSFLSGCAEPVGALFCYLLLAPFMGPTMMGTMFAAVAGVMVFISLDELLPAARAHGAGHHEVYGLVAGMAVMAVSLLLFI